MSEVRSYRRVFDLERRVYSIDRLRLNPGGVPVRGIVYLLALTSASLIAARAPLLGWLFARLPWYLRDLLAPCAVATVLTAIRIEGRNFHLAARALARLLLGPRLSVGARRCAREGRRWYPPELLLLPDGSDARPRRLRYRGPGAVLVAVAHERGGEGLSAARRPQLTLRALPHSPALARPQVIAVAAAARVRVLAPRER